MTSDLNWAEEATHLDRSAVWWRTVDVACAEWLAPGAGARVADVGCGGGSMAVALAEAVGPTGQVTALDAEPALLELAERRAADHGVADRVRVLRADLHTDLDQQLAGHGLDAPLDLVWAAHVVHHLPDQQAAISRLAGLLAAGGRLALAEGGFRMTNLPWDLGVGPPGLETRLAAAEAAWFVAMRASLPGAVRAPHGWGALMAAAGLSAVTSRSFLLDRPAPLDPHDRASVVAGLARRVERAGDDLDPDDRAAWARLLNPEDPAWLGHREDLYMLSVRTVHVGHRPA